MNSVMEIGDNVIFLYKGKKLWEGSSDEITESDVDELNEFVFATRLMKKIFPRK
jgi:phospholipid/cholesterol/gamma-HCH transport system ATP-binding protein